MTPAITLPLAKRYVLAAVVECDKCGGTARLPAPKSRPPATYTLRCHHCDNGERTEPTGTVVERVMVDESEWNLVTFRPDEFEPGDGWSGLWSEVES